MTGDLEKRLKKIKVIIYDFDGVMTDNRVLVDQNGIESVMVHRGDGYGVGRIRNLGIYQMILSTEPNPVVARRAEKLKLDVIHGVQKKEEILRQWAEEKGYAQEEMLYIGNDLNDQEAMKLAGIIGAPADAEPEILEIADWISSKNGGYGVIRDLCRILEAVMSEQS